MTSQTWIPKLPPCISPKSKSPFYASYCFVSVNLGAAFSLYLIRKWVRKSCRSPTFYCEEQLVKAWTLCRRGGMAVHPSWDGFWVGAQAPGHLPRYTKVMLQRSVILIPDQLCTALPLPRASPLGPPGAPIWDSHHLWGVLALQRAWQDRGLLGRHALSSSISVHLGEKRREA